MRFAFAAFIALFVAVLASTAAAAAREYFRKSPHRAPSLRPRLRMRILYATNFSDGTISAFTRNTNTGALSFIAKQAPARWAASGRRGHLLR